MSTIIICPRSGNFCTQTGCNKDYFVCEQLPSVATDSARLIPEEKKAESAYKEFEGKDLHIVTPESPEPQEIGIGIKSFTHAEIIAPSESQEDFAISFAKFCQVDLKGRTFNDLMSEFKSTRKPAESQEDQEELWKEARHYIDVWRIEELFKRFKITRKPE